MSDGVVSRITAYGKPMLLACDGVCEKAWGINSREKRMLSDNPDNYESLADGELGNAPEDPGTYEGGHAKPTDRRHNKWCFRECERSISGERSTVRFRNLPFAPTTNREDT